jgi:hypothetical protein
MRKHSTLYKALVAGFIAITANTIILKVAPLINVSAESGGLLKLLLLHTQQYFINYLPYIKTTGFWLLFHYLTGFAMVGMYVYLFEPVLPGKGWLKGSLFSLVPWLINGGIVLPLLGQGFMGIHQLSAAGMIYFFIANWIFGVLLGIVYEFLSKKKKIKLSSSKEI